MDSAIHLAIRGGAAGVRVGPFGAMLAAKWTAEQATLASTPAAWTQASLESLSRRAFAIALSVPGAGLGPPGRVGRVVAERPSDTRMPRQAWSLFTGSWRLVEIKKSTKSGFVGPIMALGIAAFLGLFVFIGATFGGFESWELIVAAVAAVLGVVGVANLIRVLAIPNRLTFDGQVIARWQETSDESSSRTPYYAVDDGQKVRVFSGQVALEDVVKVTVNPRNGALVNLEVRSADPADAPVPRR